MNIHVTDSAGHVRPQCNSLTRRHQMAVVDLDIGTGTVHPQAIGVSAGLQDDSIMTADMAAADHDIVAGINVNTVSTRSQILGDRYIFNPDILTIIYMQIPKAGTLAVQIPNHEILAVSQQEILRAEAIIVHGPTQIVRVFPDHSPLMVLLRRSPELIPPVFSLTVYQSLATNRKVFTVLRVDQTGGPIGQFDSGHPRRKRRIRLLINDSQDNRAFRDLQSHIRMQEQ